MTRSITPPPKNNSFARNAAKQRRAVIDSYVNPQPKATPVPDPVVDQPKKNSRPVAVPSKKSSSGGLTSKSKASAPAKASTPGLKRGKK